MNLSPDQLTAKGFVLRDGEWKKPERLDNAPVDREKDLHNMIRLWCDGQHPRVKYAYQRTDKPSGLAAGFPDFLLLMPNGKILLIECKRKGGKLSDDQLAFHKELDMLGHKCHVVYTFAEFLTIVRLTQ
jgi:hypothetical protein